MRRGRGSPSPKKKKKLRIGQSATVRHFENVSRSKWVHSKVPPGADPLKAPRPGLISARALLRPLSLTSLLRLGFWRPPSSALPTQDELKIGAQPRCTAYPAPPAAPAPRGRARRSSQPGSAEPEPSQPDSPRRRPLRPRPALPPPDSYRLGPPARRRRRGANRRLPHYGPSRAGGWDLRLQVRLGRRASADKSVRGYRPGLRSPRRAPSPEPRPSCRPQPYLVTMRLRCLALFPVVALLAAARLSAASDVLELTDDNFESRVSDTGSAGLMLVEFFAPW